MNCCCRRGHVKKDPDLSVKIAFSTRSFASDCALAMSVSPGLWFSFRRVVKCLCYNSWTLCVLFLAVSSCGLFIWANFWGKNSVRSALSSGCIFKVDLKVFPTVFKAVCHMVFNLLLSNFWEYCKFGVLWGKLTWMYYSAVKGFLFWVSFNGLLTSICIRCYH